MLSKRVVRVSLGGGETDPKDLKAAGIKTKVVRDYRQGSIRDKIADARNMEELEMVRQAVVSLARAGRISSGTLRKLDKAGAAKARELQTQRIVIPGHPGRRTKSGLYLP
jgi:hypothetical protein